MRKILLFIFLLSSFSLTAQMQMRLRGSHNPVLTPQQVDSLFYWFDAANLSSLQDSVGGAIATDEGVATWADKSGRNWDVTQSTNGARPVYKSTGGPGGNTPALQFDGSNDFLASAAHFWGSDDMTVFCVYKVANATRAANETIIAKNTATGNLRQFIIYGGRTSPYQLEAFLNSSGSSDYVEDDGGTKSTAYRVIAFTCNVSATTLYIDGASTSISRTTYGSGDGTIYNTSNKLGIGVNRVDDTPNNYLQGSISEIIVYTKALTADERVGIEEYLQAKWGL